MAAVGHKSQVGSRMVDERPRWGSQSHEERQTDGHAMRPCCRSLKVVPGREAHGGLETEDRHAMRHAE